MDEDCCGKEGGGGDGGPQHAGHSVPGQPQQVGGEGPGPLAPRIQRLHDCRYIYPYLPVSWSSSQRISQQLLLCSCQSMHFKQDFKRFVSKHLNTTLQKGILNYVKSLSQLALNISKSFLRVGRKTPNEYPMPSWKALISTGQMSHLCTSIMDIKKEAATMLQARAPPSGFPSPGDGKWSHKRLNVIVVLLTLLPWLSLCFIVPAEDWNLLSLLRLWRSFWTLEQWIIQVQGMGDGWISTSGNTEYLLPIRFNVF